MVHLGVHHASLVAFPVHSTNELDYVGAFVLHMSIP